MLLIKKKKKLAATGPGNKEQTAGLRVIFLHGLRKASFVDIVISFWEGILGRG